VKVNSFIRINSFLNDNLKNLLFYFNSLRPSGGIERVISTLANKLCKDYNVTILVKDLPISFYPLDSRVKIMSLGHELNFNMNSKFSRFFTATKSFIINSYLFNKFLSKYTYDYYYLAHPLNVLEFHFARGVNNIDTIISEHGSPEAYNFVYKTIKYLLYIKAKVYIVPTTSDVQYYNNINILAKYLPHFKSELPYTKVDLNNNIALNIGRFTDVKQQWILLEIWNTLININKITSWKLFIVGDGEHKQIFENYIKTNNLCSYVFLKPPMQDVDYYYKNSSLFLLTSKTEGFGMVLLEAISFGLPCISFDCPSGPRDIIINNKNGFLITQNNNNEYLECVVKLITNNKLKIGMGTNAFESSKDWDDDKLLNEWYTILN
jgi:glycosyltransferase involved in cell wall biosynthesis